MWRLSYVHITFVGFWRYFILSIGSDGLVLPSHLLSIFIWIDEAVRGSYISTFDTTCFCGTNFRRRIEEFARNVATKTNHQKVSNKKLMHSCMFWFRLRIYLGQWFFKNCHIFYEIWDVHLKFATPITKAQHCNERIQSKLKS